jgi:hypothetical protein
MANQMMTSDIFKNLAKVNKPHCISIFIPTHRAGQEVNQNIDQKNLKNQVKQVRSELEEWPLKPGVADALLAPVEELLNNDEFWTFQSDGLAIFRNQDRFEYYEVPVFFEAFNYVADHFYLKPLVPYLNQNERFFLLALSLHEVKFYEGFAHSLDQIEVDDLLPERIEKEVGYDFRQKYLQFRSGQTGAGQAIFHGHGEGKDDNKNEILKYFRAVNNGIYKLIRNENAPLILATVDYLVPIYKEANDYKYLFDKFIAGNPDHEDPGLLHEKAMELLNGVFDKQKQEKLAAFEQALGNNLASYKENEIIPAAINQRIDTLFVKNREELPGMYNKATNDIITEETKTKHNADLMNLAVVHTILNNGNVYLMDEDEMPEKTSKLNAIFRYNIK